MPKTILITGVSTGFGKTAVEMLLEKGHTVLAGIRGGQTRLDGIFPVEKRKRPDQLIAVDLHMDQAATFEAAAVLVKDRFGGKLDVLINNAGYGLMGPLEDQSIDQFRYQFEVNFFGPMLLTRSLLPYLRNSRGRIINVSSIVGLVTFPFYGSYAASKHALEAMTEALYYELRPFGVSVGMIEPGSFKTDFVKSLIFSEGSKSLESPYHQRSEAFIQSLKEKGHIGGDPGQVARIIVRYCDSASIPLRTLVGPDAHGMSLLKKLLPDCWRVRIEEVAFRKVMFKE